MDRTEYLIQRYLEGKETGEEFNELMELLASGQSRAIIENTLEERLKARMSEAGKPVDDALAHRLAEVRDRIELRRSWKAGVTGWLRVAASVLLLSMLSYFTWNYIGPRWQVKAEPELITVSSTPGNTVRILLDDGSLIWLKGSSRLSYPAKFSEETRQIAFEGEALFEVEKDPNRPFIIDCDHATTTVLGTSFNIKSDERSLEVVVLTGKVSVVSKGEKEAIVVTPDEKLIYNQQHSTLRKVAAADSEKLAAVNNTGYLMKFEDTRMRDVIRRIEEKFDVKITLSNTELGNCVITADLTDQSLEKTLSMIGQTLDYEYEIADGEIIFSGAGCE